MGIELRDRALLSFKAGQRRIVTAPVDVPALTSALGVSLRRPTSLNLFWNDKTQLLVSLVLQCDDYVHRATGMVIGGVRLTQALTDASAYGLFFSPQTFRPTDESNPVLVNSEPYIRLLRPGEGATVRKAWLEVEQVSGDDVDIDLLGLFADESQGSLEPLHHSVAYQGGTGVGQSFGSGVLSASYAAAGANTWLMVHAPYYGVNSSVTFTNTDGELWDSNGTVNTYLMGHACAHKIAPSTSSTAYQATVATGPNEMAVRVEQYVGVHQTTPTSSLTASDATGSASPISASPTATPDANDMVADAATALADTLGALGSNQTDRHTQTVDSQFFGHGSDRPGSSGGGAMTRALTGSVYGWRTRAFIIEEAAAGGPAFIARPNPRGNYPVRRASYY